MKRLKTAFLAVAVMLAMGIPVANAQTSNNGDTSPGQTSTAGQSLNTNFPGTIPETRFRGNLRVPNQTIFGGGQTVQDPSNWSTLASPVQPWLNIPSIVLRPYGKKPTDNLDTYIIWTTPGTTGSPAARTYTVPDAGANASFVLLQGGQSVAGVLSRADMATETGDAISRKILEVKNLDGSVLAASAASGKFGISTTATFGSPATLALVSEVANNNTKTDAFEFEFVLPPDYVAGSAITVNIYSQVQIGAGTLGATKTLTVDAFLVGVNGTGTVGSNLGPSAGTLSATAGNQAFSITPTGLVAGNKLLIQVQSAMQETAASNITLDISDVNVTCNVKM